MQEPTKTGLWAALARWLWPLRDTCELCGGRCPNAMDPRPICGPCRETIRRPGPRATCTGCLRPLLAPAPPLCSACGAGVSFTRLTAVGLYRGPLAVAVKRLKFGGRHELARPLGRLLAAALADRVAQGYVLVPVPLHRVRQHERGYNQATLLAREAGRHLRLEVASGWLRRVRATPRQARLAAADRGRDLSGAFAATAACRGRQCVLIDDVFTTGATLCGAAQALLTAGAASVQAAVLAVSDLPVTNHRVEDPITGDRRRQTSVTGG